MKTKLVLTLLAVTVACVWGTPLFAGDNASREQIVSLVDLTVQGLETDAQGTIKKIRGGAHPFVDKDNKSVYVFVYNKDVVTVAHPKRLLVGTSKKGRPDVKGNMFRDNIVNNAMAKGPGWETYYFQKPGERGIHKKEAYYKAVTGSDGVAYIAVAGRYVE